MDTLLTDELWNTIVLYLPEHAPSPKGGRPRVPDKDCLRGILFVLREGIRWQSLPKEMGWLRQYLLETLPGVERRRRLAQQPLPPRRYPGRAWPAQPGANRGRQCLLPDRKS